VRRLVLLFCLLSLLAGVPGCAYVHTRAPYDKNLDNTALGSKSGEASNYSVLWLVAWGDGGYADAAHNGGITVMRHADIEITSFLFGAFVKRTIVVYGD